MIQKGNLVYEALAANLHLCHGTHSPLAATECGYQAADKHWQHLKNHLALFAFHSRDEEILFFKTIKPKFIACLEYYRLISYTQNFCPDTLFPDEVKYFWMRQQRRHDDFCRQHDGFFRYHQSGKTDADPLLYTRRLPADEKYAPDQTASGYDELTGQLWGHERFNTYVKEQLRMCMGKNTKSY